MTTAGDARTGETLCRGWLVVALAAPMNQHRLFVVTMDGGNQPLRCHPRWRPTNDAADATPVKSRRAHERLPARNSRAASAIRRSGHGHGRCGEPVPGMPHMLQRPRTSGT
jgi:hypothetical protein